MNIAVCTLYDQNFDLFIKPVLRSLAVFAANNMADFIAFPELIDKAWSPSWNKLLAMEQCFQMGYQAVLWCDADSVALKRAKGIRHAIGALPPDIITNSDGNGICMSHIWMTGSGYNLELIRAMLSLGNVREPERFGVNIPGDEQNAFKALVRNFEIGYGTFPEGFIIPIATHPHWEDDSTSFYHLCKLTADKRLTWVERLSEEGKIP